MASPTLITPTTSKPKIQFTLIRSKLNSSSSTSSSSSSSAAATPPTQPRRHFTTLAATILSTAILPIYPSLAASDEEYVSETKEVIRKVKNTITMDRNDPNVASAVADLRETSNSWVAKYRREKSLLARTSFRDMYSALNAVSGHYVSFGPAAPIPAKRKARILEEIDTAEKALLRGR